MNTLGRRTQWEDHFTNGGTGITKFPEDHTPSYEKAIELYGKPTVWLKPGELHSTEKDLTAFWKIYDSLKTTP